MAYWFLLLTPKENDQLYMDSLNNQVNRLGGKKRYYTKLTSLRVACVVIVTLTITSYVRRCPSTVYG